MKQSLALASLLCVLAIGASGGPQQPAAKDKQQPAVVPQTTVNLISNESAESKASRAEDKSPKWYATSWAPEWALFVAACFTFWAIWRQVKETKKAADAALRTAQSIVDSERAWLIVTPEMPHNMQKAKRNWISFGFGFEWTIKNCGKTPAFIVKVGARFHPIKDFSELPAEPNIDIPDLRQPTIEFSNAPGIGPGESVERYAISEVTRPVSPDEYKEIDERKVIWVAYGVVQYRLCFSQEVPPKRRFLGIFRPRRRNGEVVNPRETRFCYTWTPGQPEDFVPSALPPEYTRQT